MMSDEAYKYIYSIQGFTNLSFMNLWIYSDVANSHMNSNRKQLLGNQKAGHNKIHVSWICINLKKKTFLSAARHFRVVIVIAERPSSEKSLFQAKT